MVPTELLAEQQHKTIAGWLSPLEVQVRLLTGSVTGATRKQVLEEIGSGQARVIVGTHALFQQGVRFARLALIIVDEQHRFGVNQRLELKQKGRKGLLSPHQLVMTATPIPRTLTMTAYADLDCSIIDELPPGRQPVGTAVMPQSRRAELVQRVRAHCGGGRQAYWVCPLIEESENLDYQAAAEVGRELADALPDLNVGLVHGRLSASEKDLVMREFSSGLLHVLVATTVVEVGVDVPNASLMVIENAERMGPLPTAPIAQPGGPRTRSIALHPALQAAAHRRGRSASARAALHHRRLCDRAEGPGVERARRGPGHTPDRTHAAQGGRHRQGRRPAAERHPHLG